MHPFAAREYRELQALDGVSFDVRQGEFFGIVGRNGSGKSTLLKLLASIYRADAGTIRMAGRLAPFIELGVGFNPELTARENVVLNGVMMGLTPQRGARPARRGHRVRRARGVRRPEAEELLLGDAGPARLLGDDPGRRRHPADRRGARGRRRRLPAEVRRRLPRDASRAARRSSSSPTTWRRSRSYCHRAMLIDDGEHRAHRRPGRGRRASTCGSTSSGGSGAGRRGRRPGEADGGAAARRLARGRAAASGSARSSRATRSGSGSSSRRREDFAGARRRLHARQRRRGRRLPVRHAVIGGDGGRGRSTAGERVRVEAEIENPLAPGRYFVHCGVNRDRATGGVALYVHERVDFVVFGGAPATGGIVVTAARDRRRPCSREGER